MPMPTTLAASLARRLHAATAIGLGLLLTAVILTQSLRFLEVALRADLGPAGYLALIGLGLPRILGHVLPFAVGGAVVFVLVLAARDGLVTVVQASGVGPAGLLLPVLALAVPAAGLQAALDYALVPAAEEALDARRDGLQATLAPGAIVAGRFQEAEPGLWVYVAEAEPGGRLSGLLVRDARGGGEVRTILADRARWTGAGGRLLLEAGSIQVDRRGPDGAPRAPSTVDFDRYAFDLGGDADAAGRRSPGPGEMRLGALRQALAEARRAAAAPDDPLVRRLSAWYQRRRAAPLLPLAFALIAAAPFLAPRPPRLSPAPRIAVVAIALLALQVALMAAWPAARASVAAGAAFTILPIAAIAVALAVALAPERLPRRTAPGPAGAAGGRLSRRAGPAASRPAAAPSPRPPRRRRCRA